MADESSELAEYVRHGREERTLEYKGSGGQESFTWDSFAVKAKLARTAMAMANIGGGVIVIGMDQSGTDEWVANGVTPEVALSYRQDDVQQFVNQRADPFVELAVRRIDVDGIRFVIIQVAGFRDLPVVCTKSGEQYLRAGAVYTRSFTKHETIMIETQSEMRELLDRAIQVGVEKRIGAIVDILRPLLRATVEETIDAHRFEQDRGDL